MKEVATSTSGSPFLREGTCSRLGQERLGHRLERSMLTSTNLRRKEKSPGYIARVSFGHVALMKVQTLAIS